METLQTSHAHSKRQTWFYIALLIVYFVFHLWILLHHEAFRDEAQAWTLAKNTSFRELFANLCIEGHPCLWFLMIRPLAKLGLSYHYFGMFSLVVMTVAAALLLFYAPFSDLLKVIVLFSFAFCYNSPVMPRTYCVITVLILLLAILWPKRSERPVLYGTLIALLFQSHIILAGFAGGLVLERFLHWLKDRPRSGKQLAGIALPCLSAACTALELHQGEDVQKFVDSTTESILAKLHFDPHTILESIYDLEETVWGHLVCELSIGPFSGRKLLLLLFALLVVSLLIAVTLHRRWSSLWGVFLIGVCGLGFALGVRLFIYSGGYHMTVCYFLMLLFLVWVIFLETEDVSVRRISALLLAFALLLTNEKWINAVKYDLNGDFSGSLRTAEYICENVPEGSVVVVKEHYLIPSVFAYVESDRKDIEFWSVDTGEDYRFHVWGREISEQSNDELAETALSHFPDAKAIYFLSARAREESEDLELLFSMPDRNPLEENYWFYQIR